MPTTYLISKRARTDPDRLAPWDRSVPLLPRLPLEQAHLEPLRYLQIENIVTTSASDLPELKKLTYRGSKKRPATGSSSASSQEGGSKFESTRFKLRRPRATTLLFPSGNQVVAGTKSVSKALLAHHCFARIMSRLTGTRGTRCHSFGIQNIVSSAHFGHKIDIAKFAKSHDTEVSYDPMVFPGARCRMHGAPTSTLLFSSGNAVITGAKAEEDAVQSYHIMHQKVAEYFTEEAEPHKDKGSRYDATRAVTEAVPMDV